MPGHSDKHNQTANRLTTSGVFLLSLFLVLVVACSKKFERNNPVDPNGILPTTTATPADTVSATPDPNSMPTDKILFGRDSGTSGAYTINPDGTGLTMVVADCSFVDWNSTFTELICSKGVSGWNQVHKANADGSGLVNISANPGVHEYAGTWSPDDLTIAIVTPDGAAGDIWTMDPDGSNKAILLANGVFDGRPKWSQDGSQMAWYNESSGFPGDLHKMDSDGTNVVQLTATVGFFDASPDWSNDGTKIIFHSNTDGDYDIYQMDSDGSNVINLTNNTFNDKECHFSKNGLWIVFTSNRDGGSQQVYVMKADGTNQTRVEVSADNSRAPVW